MATKKDIKFSKYSGVNTFETCCSCGNVYRKSNDSFVAIYKINESLHTEFHACKITCIVNFFAASNTIANEFINERIRQSCAIAAGYNNHDYYKELLKIHNIKDI